MGKHILLVGLGGFIGSVARYLLSTTITKWFPHSFPFGTFVVNVSGCLLIGIIYGLSTRFGWLNQEWRIFLATGICGGFTTFSAFAYESFRLAENSEYLTFAAYTSLSFLICLVAVFFGIAISKL
jgi:fluoride exporter